MRPIRPICAGFQLGNRPIRLLLAVRFRAEGATTSSRARVLQNSHKGKAKPRGKARKHRRAATQAAVENYRPQKDDWRRQRKRRRYTHDATTENWAELPNREQAQQDGHLAAEARMRRHLAAE